MSEFFWASKEFEQILTSLFESKGGGKKSLKVVKVTEMTSDLKLEVK